MHLDFRNYNLNYKTYNLDYGNYNLDYRTCCLDYTYSRIGTIRTILIATTPTGESRLTGINFSYFLNWKENNDGDSFPWIYEPNSFWTY